MEKEINISIDRLIGSIHVSVHPSPEGNPQLTLPDNNMLPLGDAISDVIWPYLLRALSSPEMKEVLERRFSNTEFQKPHQCKQDTED